MCDVLLFVPPQVRTVEDAKDAHKKELRRVPGKDAASKVAASDVERRAIQVLPLFNNYEV